MDVCFHVSGIYLEVVMIIRIIATGIYLLCARHGTLYFIYVISLNPYNHPEGQELNYHATDMETGLRGVRQLAKVTKSFVWSRSRTLVDYNSPHSHQDSHDTPLVKNHSVVFYCLQDKIQPS